MTGFQERWNTDILGGELCYFGCGDSGALPADLSGIPSYISHNVSLSISCKPQKIIISDILNIFLTDFLSWCQFFSSGRLFMQCHDMDSGLLPCWPFEVRLWIIRWNLMLGVLWKCRWQWNTTSSPAVPRSLQQTAQLCVRTASLGEKNLEGGIFKLLES